MIGKKFYSILLIFTLVSYQMNYLNGWRIIMKSLKRKPMRSKISQSILDETSEETKAKVRADGFKRAKKRCRILKWFPFAKRFLND
jgi:hypothetical protein